MREWGLEGAAEYCLWGREAKVVDKGEAVEAVMRRHQHMVCGEVPETAVLPLVASLGYAHGSRTAQADLESTAPRLYEALPRLNVTWMA
jgi:hypothetical protein